VHEVENWPIYRRVVVMEKEMKMNTWPIYRRVVVIEKEMKMKTCLIV
jgi:hypothetical protein